MEKTAHGGTESTEDFVTTSQFYCDFDYFINLVTDTMTDTRIYLEF